MRAKVYRLFIFALSAICAHSGPSAAIQRGSRAIGLSKIRRISLLEARKDYRAFQPGFRQVSCSAAKTSNYAKDLKDVKRDEEEGSGPKTYYRTLYRLNMRNSKDVDSALVGVLPVGSKVVVRQIEGRRAMLETSGLEGWISLATESGDLNVEYLSGPDGSRKMLRDLKGRLETEYKAAEEKRKSEIESSEQMPLALQIVLPFLAIAAAYGGVSLVTAGIVQQFFPTIFGK
eukprot:CAMPEP_0167746012 /NCGR_PEP_ID=MMETSP0110_2-20121227/3470_1 /TAXON_ID=629695 /ORGANISM="Gymnochlora sp., Strain CCMP2014" /LENGTH=230 /DNA_ID=CAMNT_0007630717 /DNA_START=124 /DNA_END=816 /DNA_ORIENTATION=+